MYSFTGVNVNHIFQRIIKEPGLQWCALRLAVFYVAMWGFVLALEACDRVLWPRFLQSKRRSKNN